MPFENFFVRTTYKSFGTGYREFLRMGINPEIYFDCEILNDLTSEDINNVGEVLGKFEANTIHAPFFDISTGGNDSDIREISLKKLTKVIEMGNRWNSVLVVIHYNYDRIYYREHLEEWLEKSADFFITLSSKYRLPLIALENIDDPDPSVALELEKRVGNDNIIHCFDYGHHNVFGKIRSSEWLSRIKSDKHIHFHFHDNDGSGDDHKPMGDGSIDWVKVKREILELNIPFSVTMEPHTKRDMLRSIEYYRKYFLKEM